MSRGKVSNKASVWGFTCKKRGEIAKVNKWAAKM